ncbi:MAG: cupin domain-containing protein [Pirellulales bacterium]
MTSSQNDRRYRIARIDEIPAVDCPCGQSRRAFLDEPDRIASLHVVTIDREARRHYHRQTTEIYYVLEGEGHVELDGESIQVRPGSSILIKPGCRHRAVGTMKIVNVAIPAFDPEDEWFD